MPTGFPSWGGRDDIIRVTTFSDMYMFMTDTAQAVLDCGMRAVLSRGLTGPDEHMEQRYRKLMNWPNGKERQRAESA